MTSCPIIWTCSLKDTLNNEYTYQLVFAGWELTILCLSAVKTNAEIKMIETNNEIILKRKLDYYRDNTKRKISSCIISLTKYGIQ